jgi:hypothetical protein
METTADSLIYTIENKYRDTDRKRTSHLETNLHAIMQSLMYKFTS